VVNLDYNSCRGVGKHSTFLTHEGWVEAGSLTIGDQILSLDGTFGDVESISISNDPQVMYNLTVDISHTFAVGEGQWVVHNCSSPVARTSNYRVNVEEFMPSPVNGVKYEVHHVVPQKHGLAEDSREILRQYDIDINSPANLLWLPAYQKDVDQYFNPTTLPHHGGGLHTDEGIRLLNERLKVFNEGTATQAQVIVELDRIKDEILRGVWLK
jgi:hypothetical protein